MNPVKQANQNTIRKCSARLLLLTGYIFLFATQFNYRYYNAANFFVYHPGTINVVGQGAPGGTNLGIPKAAHPQIYHDNAQRPAHLSVDKRFRFRVLIKPVFVCTPAPVPSYVIITRKALPPPVVYSTPDLPTNCFRGPPTA